MCGTPPRDVVRRGRPLLAREVCQPATKPPPPLLEPPTYSEVQKPPEGGAPSGDIKETTPPEQHTRQIPVHRKDLLRDRIVCSRCKDSTGHRMEKRANIDFCLGGITNEIPTPETKVLVTLYNYAVHSFLTLIQPRVDVHRNSKHYHSHSKCLTILDRGVSEFCFWYEN